jgi:uracil-DNA glycosylase
MTLERRESRSPKSRPANRSISRILDDLVALAASGHVTNFYAVDQGCCQDSRLSTEPAATRRERMSAHLTEKWAAPLLLVGEAAGWRGARQTGLPFTAPFDVHGIGMREASATVVRQTIADSGIIGQALTWNAYPLHPHQPGIAATNRPPTASEIRAALPLLEQLSRNRRIVAIGRRAADALAQILGAPVPVASSPRTSSGAVQVRHPSFGGVQEFREQFAVALTHFGLTELRRTGGQPPVT